MGRLTGGKLLVVFIPVFEERDGKVGRVLVSHFCCLGLILTQCHILVEFVLVTVCSRLAVSSKYFNLFLKEPELSTI